MMYAQIVSLVDTDVKKCRNGEITIKGNNYVIIIILAKSCFDYRAYFSKPFP